MTDAGAVDLNGYIEIWWESVGDFLAVAETIPDDAWDRSTDLPAWDVKAVVSHVAHLESLLAGGPHEEAEVGDAPHLDSPMSRFTEIGVVNRRDTPPAEILAEIRRCTTSRHERLREDPPSDPTAPAPGVFGAIGWDLGLLLRNRPLDLWMHEQDLRRALGTPGGLDTRAADHTVGYLGQGLGFVLAKRAGAQPGTTLVLAIDGDPPTGHIVAADGRGRPLPEPPDNPTVTVGMDRDTFVRLVGGRGPVPPDAVRIDGDRDLGATVAARLTLTP
ncbi:MAG: maleylpyruvate isomerase family mycothiol-dependent enzyme [Nocardioides sp.]|uniref:maleylpyruvate isomerase family mycothiol-dependent enzyme n=1 Tax=Nocardioides sp. TaxID=35761 RepID=UPI0039E422C3